jgi:hypothetical protein
MRRDFPIPRMPTPPRTIFKYQQIAEYTLRSLGQREIYFNSPRRFNDPYDCTITAKYRVPTDEELERLRLTLIENSRRETEAHAQFKTCSSVEIRNSIMRSARALFQQKKDEFLENNGVCCFSERNDDLLMWGHYGGSYRGFCLEFRTEHDPFNRLRQVKYVDNIPEIDLVPFLLHGDAEQFADLYCTKSSAWAYEREWRGIHVEANKCYRYENWGLKAVYFGPSISDDDRASLRFALRDRDVGVEFWQGRKSDEEFRIEFERLS